MGIEFLKKIFSIQDYGETHHILYIFGIKVKFPKSQFSKKRNKNPYYFYKKNNVDITTIPPADGQLRELQLANLELLKELDYVCKQSGLKYWLDFGTLLGAVRHKGYIPWDDDIDVGMMREDYNKIIDAFNNSSRNSDIYATEVRCGDNNKTSFIIKVLHRQCPYLFVDIFPYDYLGQKLQPEDQNKLSSHIKNIRKYINSICSITMKDEEIKEKIKYEHDHILKNKEYLEESDIVKGLEFDHYIGGWIFSYGTFFPLKDISFEGVKFTTINNEKLYLKSLYGNYMSYPKRIGVGHNMLFELSEKGRKIIKDLIKKGEHSNNG